MLLLLRGRCWQFSMRISSLFLGTELGCRRPNCANGVEEEGEARFFLVSKTRLPTAWTLRRQHVSIRTGSSIRRRKLVTEWLRRPFVCLVVSESGDVILLIAQNKLTLICYVCTLTSERMRINFLTYQYF